MIILYNMHWHGSIDNCVKLKGVVPILTTLNWLTLTPKTHFFIILPQADFLFSLLRQKQVHVTLGMRLFMKMHKKIKICIQKICIFCYNFQSIVNLRLKFCGYNEKNMGFHLTLKNELFLVVPWGWECNGQKVL